MLTPDVPDDFAESYPEPDRNRLWEEEVAEQVTRAAKRGPVPSGNEEFDEAWQLLSNDRPDVPAEECRLRRRLIRKFFWTITDYEQHYV